MALGFVLIAISVIALSETGDAHRHASSTSVPGWASRQLMYFLGSETPSTVSMEGWRRADAASGGRFVATVRGLGLVQFDAGTHELDEVIFSDRLARNGSALVDPQAAGVTAATYAARHFSGFAALARLPEQTVDHGSFTEYRFQWQQRLGDAWTPTGVTVGINAHSGAVAYYYSDRVDVRTPTTPGISSDQARSIAARIGANLSVGRPELRVEVVGGAQVLCWIVPLRESPTAAPHIPQDKIASIDAMTGKIRRIAIAS